MPQEDLSEQPLRQTGSDPSSKRAVCELPPLHIPRPYARPQAPLARTLDVVTEDGAHIYAFFYALPQDAPAVVNAAVAPSFPVLMLHGNGEEHGIFGALIDALVGCGRSVLAVDSRGQGRSTRGSAALSYELMRDDALAALNAASIAKAHVLGFSDGAIEGLLLARDYPERVASLCSIGANLSPDALPDNDFFEEMAKAWRRWSRAGNEQAHYEDGTPAPTRLEAQHVAELLHLMVVEPHIEAASLQTISCPTCIMAGELDDIPQEETQRIARAIPHAREVLVAGADHTLPKVAIEAVLRELLITIAEAEKRELRNATP